MNNFDFEKFFDRSLDMLCISDFNGFFKHINPSFERVLGWSIEDLTTHPFLDFVHPDDVAQTVKEMEKLSTGNVTLSFQNRWRCANGSFRHLSWTAFPEKENNVIYAIARDISDLLAMTEINERFRLAIEASPVAMLMVHHDGTIKLTNQEADRLFGYPGGALIDQPIELLVPANVHHKHQKERAHYNHAPEVRSMGVGRHLQGVRRDGSEFEVEIGLTPVEFSDGVHVICSVIDLTFQKQTEARIILLSKNLQTANAELLQIASTDQLTGINNRRVFDEQLDFQVRLMKRMNKPLSLLMIDIDHFKQYNDQFGHPAGDEILKTVADLLTRKVRSNDVVARYGGEEFAIILPDTDQKNAMQLSRRIQASVHEKQWEKMEVTVSLGAATLMFPLESSQNETQSALLLSEADQALYHSKTKGRDQTSHFSEIKK